MIDIYLIASVIIGTILFGSFLFYKKWQLKHIISMILSLVFVFVFASYGVQILTYFWSGANASDLWWIMFIIMFGGGWLLACIPFFIDGKLTKKERQKMWRLLKIFLVTGLIFTIADNDLYGPYAVGPSSPYLTQQLCHLNPTYVSSDVFFGCQMQRLGLDAFTNFANSIVYTWLTILVILIAGFVIGFRHLEKMIYGNGKKMK